MTLTTHAIVGAAVASLVPQYPVAGFVLGFASHFVIDSIPHWNEGGALLYSNKEKRGDHTVRIVRYGAQLLHDVAVVLADSLIGFILASVILWGFFGVPLFIVLLGAFAGQMPDGLQFVYFVYKLRFMEGLQKFHSRIQTEYDNPSYLTIEAGLILAVVVLGISGVFMLQ
jgi:hypothetical protein